MNSPMERRVRSVASAQPQRSSTYYARGPSPATTARVSTCGASVGGAVNVGDTQSGRGSPLRGQCQAARPATASAAVVAALSGPALRQLHSALPATTFGKDIRMVPIPNNGKDYAISSKESVRYRVALQGGIGQPPSLSHFQNTCGSYGNDTVVSEENFFVATTFPKSQQQTSLLCHHQSSHTKNESGRREERDGNGEVQRRAAAASSTVDSTCQRPKTADAALLLLNSLRMSEEDGGSGGRRVGGIRHPHKVSRFAEHSSAHVYHKVQSGNNINVNTNTSGGGGGFDSVLSFKPQFASTVPSARVADASSTDTYLETHPRAAAVPMDLVDYERLLAPHLWQRKVQRQLRHQKTIAAAERFKQRGGRECSHSAGRRGVCSSRSSSASSFAEEEEGRVAKEKGEGGAPSLSSLSSRSPTTIMQGGGVEASFPCSLFQTTRRAADGSARFGIVRDTAAAIEATACRSTRPKHFEKAVLDAATANNEKNNNKRKKTATTTSPHIHSTTMTGTYTNSCNNGTQNGLLDTLRAQHGRYSNERLGLTAANSLQFLSASSLAALGGSSSASPSPYAQQPRQARPGFGGEEARAADSSQISVASGYRHELIGGNRRNDLAKSALTGLLVTTFAGRGKGAGGHFGDGCCGSHPRGVVPPPPLPLNASSSSRLTRGTDEDLFQLDGFTYHAYDLSSTSAFANASKKSEATMLRCGERQPIAFGRHRGKDRNNATNGKDPSEGGGEGLGKEAADLVGVDVSVGAERRRREGIARARGAKAHVRFGTESAGEDDGSGGSDSEEDFSADVEPDGCRGNHRMKKGHQQQQKDPGHPHHHDVPLRPHPPTATSPRPSPEVVTTSATVRLPPSSSASSPTISSPSFSSFVSKSHNAQLMRQQKRRAVVLGQQ